MKNKKDVEEMTDKIARRIKVKFDSHPVLRICLNCTEDAKFAGYNWPVIRKEIQTELMQDIEGNRAP